MLSPIVRIQGVRKYKKKRLTLNMFTDAQLEYFLRGVERLFLRRYRNFFLNHGFLNLLKKNSLF